ncbi:hypothetical protein OPV22_017976 [Ensete ventricosum]|uniref:Uncharacterized protein n=1 Tax=Ensete ventricosum TaxID=4639 RepID=A0AAV8QUG1_ENSVE|nr:hypothetical protein OPV22_017976 [Ensete ventricosum]
MLPSKSSLILMDQSLMSHVMCSPSSHDKGGSIEIRDPHLDHPPSPWRIPSLRLLQPGILHLFAADDFGVRPGDHLRHLRARGGRSPTLPEELLRAPCLGMFL